MVYFVIGPIPSSIGSLTLLTNLQLFNNKLSGMRQLLIFSTVFLSAFGLGAIPSSVGSLTKLSYLYLYNNCLYGIGKCIHTSFVFELNCML